MSFSQPKYVRCPECFGEGNVETFTWVGGVPVSEYKNCEVCEGSGKVWDEQLPEEQNNEE